MHWAMGIQNSSDSHSNFDFFPHLPQDTARLTHQDELDLLEKRAQAMCKTVSDITSIDGPVHSSTARKLFLDALKRVTNPRQCKF